ncbi:MAG: hypothetical protein HY701_07360 [Gemmatimonadetes bacterium]|nr:hypothetical protein [Gemmatimonadota bacterium]
MRICSDGFMVLNEYGKMRTPGPYDCDVEPMPEEEAVSFLLSHSFPGRRRIVRPLTIADRRAIKLASWASSVSERMALLDPVWRGITVPVDVHENGHAVLIQVAQYREQWAYPLYIDRGTTCVHPAGGVAVAKLNGEGRVHRVQMCGARANGRRARPHAANGRAPSRRRSLRRRTA